jgi:hypothetical protein
MFSFGIGKSVHPHTNKTATPRKHSKEEIPQDILVEAISSPESLEPAIDGPPSSERIRAYTEQMKRGAFLGNNTSRTESISSNTSSFHSRDSSTDNVTLSRKSSGRSISSSMPSLRGERPESALFGSIFSRTGRKSKGGSGSGLRTSASSINIGSTVKDGSARDNFYGRTRGHRRQHFISEPYNFQHVTHTQKDHLPTIERRPVNELVSEFSTLRASQAPTSGQLKGIEAQDLHFDNFSSEALVEDQTITSTGSPQRNIIRKSHGSYKPSLSHSKSHDNLRTALARPSLSPNCPIALPVRTSSRSASISLDPMMAPIIERPYPNEGFRRPAPFNLPTPPPRPARDVTEEYFTNPPVQRSSPEEVEWPLAASPGFGAELADVQEEEEEVMPRRSRNISTPNGELRLSKSFPALQRTPENASIERSEARMSLILGQTPTKRFSMCRRAPSPEFQFATDSWESDIDWCYEHEVEADCDYEWERPSPKQEPFAEVTRLSPRPSTAVPLLDLQVQNDEREYHGRFRPSLLIASPMEPPELSPMSTTNSVVSSDPRTPMTFLRPHHIRTHSQASSFKESHGFTLSPSLLIPADFQTQIDQDALYNEEFGARSSTNFAKESYDPSISSIDCTDSSTTSQRSSNFSRDSARSSSSTRISGTASRGSQDSMVLLSKIASLKESHYNSSSASSLPDLIPSILRPIQADLSASVPSLNASEVPAVSLQHRRNMSQIKEQEKRVDLGLVIHQALTPSPEKDTFPDLPLELKSQKPIHERKKSAPVASQKPREFKPRARAATSAVAGAGKKQRGSYMLFPQV